MGVGSVGLGIYQVVGKKSLINMYAQCRFKHHLVK